MKTNTSLSRIIKNVILLFSIDHYRYEMDTNRENWRAHDIRNSNVFSTDNGPRSEFSDNIRGGHLWAAVTDIYINIYNIDICGGGPITDNQSTTTLMVNNGNMHTTK
jgi:hypothetical protein